MLLERYKKYVNNNYKLIISNNIKEETEIFLSNGDTITPFIDQIIIKTENDKDIIRKTEMYKIYKLFACTCDKIANVNEFKTALESKGYIVRRKDGYDVYRGIKINKTKMDEKIGKNKPINTEDIEFIGKG